MSILAFTNIPFLAEVDFGQSRAGVTTVGYTIRNADGTTTPSPAQPRTQTGVIAFGLGKFGVSLTISSVWAGDIYWDDGQDPLRDASESIQVTGVSEITVGSQDYVPSVAEVGAYLRARTRDTGGTELGTFTTGTHPTDAEVETIILNAAAKLASRVGNTVAPGLAVAAREVVALRSALMVELGFFGDQIQAGRSPYNELKALYDQSYQEFLDARRDLGADQLAGTDDDLSPSGLPVFAFTDPNLDWHVPGTELAWPPVAGGPLW